MRFWVVLLLVGAAVFAFSWGVQFGRLDNNICIVGPCISPLRFSVGSAFAFAAWATWTHRVLPNGFNGDLGTSGARWGLRLAAIVAGVFVVLAATLLAIVLEPNRPNQMIIGGGFIGGFLTIRFLWRRFERLIGQHARSLPPPKDDPAPRHPRKVR